MATYQAVWHCKTITNVYFLELVNKIKSPKILRYFQGVKQIHYIIFVHTFFIKKS